MPFRARGKRLTCVWLVLVDRAVPCSMFSGIARGAADPPLFFFVAFCLKLERLTSVWLVKRLARRFGQEVLPHHRKSSTRFDARQHRSEIRSCRSRFGLWQNEFLR